MYVCMHREGTSMGVIKGNTKVPQDPNSPM